MNMELKIIEDFSGIKKEDWDALLVLSETNVPFLRYGFQESWWRHKGGGEWPQDSQLMLAAGYEGGRLVGIAPLFSPAGTQQKKLVFIGSIEISDYLDIICLPDHKEGFIQALLNFVEKDLPEIEKIDLVNIPEESTTINMVKNLVRKTGWQTNIDQAYHTPAIRLAGDWDTYLAGIDKKQRHEIRRKMRRADENSDTMKWYVVSERENLDSEIEAFFSMMEMDHDKRKFLTPEMRAQMRDIMQWAFEERFLQLAFLQIDKGKASAYLSFDYNDHILVYNSAFDYEYSEFSPGWVLLSYLIRHAIEAGKTNFDFMRGDETYKYRFGAEDGFVMRVQITRA